MKARAVIEVVVVFSLTLFFVALVGLSPIGEWERQVSNHFFIEYAVWIAFPLLILVVARRNLASYGLSLRNLRYHLDIAATAFVPVAIASVPLAFVNYKHWWGALIMAGVEIALLFALGWLLKRKPTQNESGILVGAVLLVACSNLTQKATLNNAVSAFVFYIFFVGLGEELLFRGYIQSRLNAAWGRPFRFYGVNRGWGVVIASIWESHDARRDSQRLLCPARRSRARTQGTLRGALPAGRPQLRWQHRRLVRGVLRGRASAFTAPIQEAADRWSRAAGSPTLRGPEWLRCDDERIRSS
jgi:membrane protease YdiL (CAAX protease family)